MSKIRWGVLSTARIGQNHVIPAMQQGTLCEVTAIASRDKQRAETVAQKFRIPKAYGSYDQLLADPDVDAIYIPLPNEQHVPWSIKTLEAGKHVLCEKPVALTADEAQTLVDAASQHPQLKIMEAFMYRFHPQWQRAKQLVTDGAIGDLRTIQSFFSYANVVRAYQPCGRSGFFPTASRNFASAPGLLPAFKRSTPSLNLSAA